MVRIRIQLDAEAGKLADTVQRAVAKGFQGAGQAGLATDPRGIANQIMGNVVPGQGMRRYRGVYRNIITPNVENMAESLGDKFYWSKRTPPTIASVMEQGQANRSQFLKNFGFAGIPVLSPTSLLGNLFATRQIFSAFQGPVGQGILGRVGLGGMGVAGGALATGGVMAAALALGFSLKALERIVKEVANAFESARKLYAKAVVSGTGLQFSAFKQNLSQILGVDENEVFKFGAELGNLAPKLQWANKTMADSAREAGSVGQEIKLLEINFKALFMEIAAGVAPAIRKLIAGLAGTAQAFDALFKKLLPFIQAASAIGGAAGASKLAPILTSIAFPAGGGIMEAFLKGMKNNDIGKLPAPEGIMKQLPASAFERMGLVIKGFGPGNDYARRTAIATEKTAKLLNAAYSGGGVARSYQFFNPVANSP